MYAYGSNILFLIFKFVVKLTNKVNQNKYPISNNNFPVFHVTNKLKTKVLETRVESNQHIIILLTIIIQWQIVTCNMEAESSKI